MADIGTRSADNHLPQRSVRSFVYSFTITYCPRPRLLPHRRGLLLCGLSNFHASWNQVNPTAFVLVNWATPPYPENAGSAFYGPPRVHA